MSIISPIQQIMRKPSQIQTFFVACSYFHTSHTAIALRERGVSAFSLIPTSAANPCARATRAVSILPSHYNCKVSYHSTSMSMSDNDVVGEASVTKAKSSFLVEDSVLVLPYQDGSHGSAKIVISTDDDLYNSSSPNALSVSSFQDRLRVTISALKQLRKSSLWIEVPMSHARYVEACSDIEGLLFHHAKGDKVHLSLWLKEDVENKIPEYATHQVGVGAIVINSRNEILCVRELRRNFRKWKIPGGLAELGEDLEDAAIREVMEETGIQCRFKNVLGFRHTHGVQFGRSDMYFVCRLEPVEGDGQDGIPEPVAQDGEIALAAWVPMQEYMDMIDGRDDDNTTNNSTSPHPMMQKMMELLNVNGIERTVVKSIVPGRKPNPIYHAPHGSIP